MLVEGGVQPENLKEEFMKLNKIDACYKPYSWFPHITLGKKLEKEQMIMAMRVLQTYFIPIKGEIVRLGLSQTNPHKDIFTITLKD